MDIAQQIENQSQQSKNILSRSICIINSDLMGDLIITNLSKCHFFQF